MQIRAIDRMPGFRGQLFRLKGGVSHHGETAGELLYRTGSEAVGLSHGTSVLIVRAQIVSLKRGSLRLLADLVDSICDPVFDFRHRISWERVAEILHDVKAVSATQHGDANDVIGRVEQVGAMRRREHQVFVAGVCAVVEGEIFALAIELQRCGCGQPFGQRLLAIELMRKLMGIDHYLRVKTSGGGQSGVQRERLGANLATGLVGEKQELLLRLPFGIAKRKVGGRRRSRLQQGPGLRRRRCESQKQGGR